MAHHVSYESTGVTLTLSGRVEADEIRALNEQLMSDELFPQWRYQIWDFSNVEEFEPSFEQLRSFARQDAIAARRNPNQRIALVHQESSDRGLGRIFHIYEAVWGGYESKTFSDVDAARAWAGSSPKRDDRAT